MDDLLLPDLESLEAISQDEETRTIFLRMAALSRAGRIEPFLAQLAADEEVDEETKVKLAEICRDRSLLFTVEDYLCRTQRLH